MPGSQEKTSLQQWAEYIVAQILLFTLSVLPIGLANRAANIATRLLDCLMPRLRRIALVNLSFAYPELSAEARSSIVDGVFRNIARLLVAFARFPKLHAGNIHEWVTYQGLENYLSAKKRGNGILVATAHFGNWELSAFGHAVLTEPMNVMVRPLDNRLVDQLVEHRRSLSGNRLIEKRDAARIVLKALRANEAVGILCDQNTTPAEGVFVDFFGKSACASTGIIKLAHHSGAAVLPGYAVWDEATQRYTIVFEPEIQITGNVEADLQGLHSVLERAIRRHPDQWLWIHRRWKTRPPGERSLYD